MKTITISTALTLVLVIAAVAGPAPGSTKAIGSPTAPITIDLFSDFQCSHCKELHDEALPSLIADFVDTGKVYLVRHYFLLPRPYSRPSATYVCAAERIGKYNPVSDVLFKTQMSWAQTGKIDEIVSSVLSPADMQKVRVLVKDPSVTAEIDKDTASGSSQGVNQTPTMIIVHNGRHTPISGVISYSLLKMYLEKVLTQ
jgi:protein-disulfide isomerase